jgi:hypothetical protein
LDIIDKPLSDERLGNGPPQDRTPFLAAQPHNGQRAYGRRPASAATSSTIRARNSEALVAASIAL